MFKFFLVLLCLVVVRRSLTYQQRSRQFPNDSIGPALIRTRVKRLTGVPKPVWHVGIYYKKNDPWEQICGGSVVTTDVVISAAHCFWDDDTGLQPAQDYAVGGNKNFKPWDYVSDRDAQKSDVSKIIIPVYFRGVKTNFQADIAVLKLTSAFKFTRGLRPICVDFDEGLESQQLKDGNSGTIAGWGYTDAFGEDTQRLLWLELPYVDIGRCFAGAEETFLKYITLDKICAGDNDTGKAVCKGDSGGALTFFRGIDNPVPYLRGVASTAPGADNLECNVFAVATFTRVSAHRSFLEQHVPGVEWQCKKPQPLLLDVK